MIKIAQPLLGTEEREAVLGVLDSGQIAAGPVTQRLEEEFAARVSGTLEAVAVANGTAALHLALLAHAIGPGDEVITTAFSFQATANMVLAVGARPVFVDVRDDGNIEPDQIEAAITSRTKAVLPVHLYGRLCDIEVIEEIARRNSLVLIEDAAQAHGATACAAVRPEHSVSPKSTRRGESPVEGALEGRDRPAGRAGSFGTGCFSLYATKNMTAGEGGLITTNDPDLAARLRRLRSHGESKRYLSVELGFNYRMSDLTAAVALAQLEKLAGFNEKRRHNAAFLSANLRGVILPPQPEDQGRHVWHQYTVRVREGRDDLAAWLGARDIESAVFYPLPLPDQPLYQGLGLGGHFPVAARLAAEVLSIPVHPGLSQDDLEQIVEAVNGWSEGRGRK